MINILLASADVQPIAPSRIVDAAQGAGQGAMGAGQSLAGSLAYIALFVGGLILLVGIGLSMARITQKVLQVGIGIFLGTVIMFICLMYPDKVVGVISGFLNSFFSYLTPG
ncbi:MAG TPA: hypothetical protein GXX59_02330 [Syntrophomonadaceae bacterium]|jgi:hypothetical protein|nr:hypothetical protein [Syntrophomonadaceae bacterium]